MGLNRILPLVRNMHVMLFESKPLPGRPGLVIIQTEWNEDELAGARVLPPGEPAFLRKILEWHGAAQVGWAGTHQEEQSCTGPQHCELRHQAPTRERK